MRKTSYSESARSKPCKIFFFLNRHECYIWRIKYHLLATKEKEKNYHEGKKKNRNKERVNEEKKMPYSKEKEKKGRRKKKKKIMPNIKTKC